jgi:hypothetical protein
VVQPFVEAEENPSHEPGDEDEEANDPENADTTEHVMPPYWRRGADERKRSVARTYGEPNGTG